MDDFNFDTSGADVSSDSTFESEPSVEIPEETQLDPEPPVEIESDAEPSVESLEDVSSEIEAVPDNPEGASLEPESSVDIPEADELVTIHPYRSSVEVLPNVETMQEKEPISVDPNIKETDVPNDEVSKPIPPEGWTPGGPEHGG